MNKMNPPPRNAVKPRHPRKPWLSLATAALIVTTVHADDLVEVYRTAVNNDPTLLGARAARGAADSRLRQAYAGFLPQADLSVHSAYSDRNVGDTSTDQNSNGYDLSMTVPLYHQDSYKKLSQAKAGIDQSAAELSATEANAIVRVAERYYTTLAAIDNLEFARAEKEAIGRQLEQTKQRFEVGLIAITDVHEAQAAYDQVVAGEILAQNELANSHEALREITGRYHDKLTPLGKDVALAPPQPNQIDAWVKRALENNNTVHSAAAAVDVARERMLEQRAGHMPTLDLTAEHSYLDDGGSIYNNQDVTENSVRLLFNLPLSRGGAVTARTQEQQQVYDQAKYALEAAKRTAQRQASDAYLAVVASISRTKALKQAVVSTQSALKAAEAGLEVGTRTTVDVLITRRELFRAQRDHSRARYDYVLNLFRLNEASGEMTVAELEQINKTMQ
jgi:outer membrane protein